MIGLDKICEIIDGEIIGNSDISIKGLCDIEEGENNCLSFVRHKSYENFLLKSVSPLTQKSRNSILERRKSSSQSFKEILKNTGNKLLVYHPTDRREDDNYWGDQYYKPTIVRKRRKMTWDFSDTDRFSKGKKEKGQAKQPEKEEKGQAKQQEKVKGSNNYLGRLLMYIRNYLHNGDKYYLERIEGIDVPHDTAYHEYTEMEKVFKDIIPRETERRQKRLPPYREERRRPPYLVPRQSPSSDDFLSICTLNMNQGGGRRWGAVQFEILKGKRDVLCLQEYKRTLINRKYKHNIIHPDDRDITENVSIHSDMEIKDVEILDDDSKCNTKRYAIIATIKGIKIANCHLCGGTNDDRKIHRDDDLENKKLTLLTKVIKENPDIIVGDFNSNSLSLDDFSIKEKGYWSEIHSKEHVSGGLDDFLTKKVRPWNNMPFNLLEQNHYTRVPIVEPTSEYGGSVDHIYYNSEKIKIGNSGIVDLIHPEISDHNAVWAEVKKK